MALRSAAQRLTVSVGQCIWRGLEPGVTRAGRGAAFDGVGFDAIVAVANAVGVSIGPSQLKQSIADVIGRGRGEGRRQPGARHELYAGDEAQVLGTLAMDTCGLQHRLTDQMVRQEPGPQLLRPHLWRFAVEPVRLHRHFDLPERDFRSPASAKQCRQLSAGDFGVIQQLCHPGAMWRSPVTGGESWRWQSRYTALTCTELRAGGRRFPDQTSLGQTIVDQTILGQASRASPV
jgi:hypothetical protein